MARKGLGTKKGYVGAHGHKPPKGSTKKGHTKGFASGRVAKGY